MKAQIRRVHGNTEQGDYSYDAVVYWCPGPNPGYTADIDGKPVTFEPHDCGLHMLPIRGTGDSNGRPAWELHSLDPLHIEPSVLTRGGGEGNPNDARPLYICHSFVRNGMIEFLSDCTHALAGQTVPMVDLPDYYVKDDVDDGS